MYRGSPLLKFKFQNSNKLKRLKFQTCLNLNAVQCDNQNFKDRKIDGKLNSKIANRYIAGLEEKIDKKLNREIANR